MSPAAPLQPPLTLEERVALHPLDANSWIQLGVAAFDAGDGARAVWALGRAAELNVADGKCREMLALAALSDQRWDVAQRVQRQLLDNFPSLPGTHVIDGHLQKMQGRIPEAAAAYGRALILAPHSTEALFNLVDLQVPAPDEALARRIGALLQNGLSNETDLANLAFARGRILETAGQVAEAFAAYSEANRAVSRVMKRKNIEYDPIQTDRQVEQILTAWPATAVGSPLEPLPVPLRVIFIVGMPRSGSTLIEQMLGGHPEVQCGGELPAGAGCERYHAQQRRLEGLQGPIDPTNSRERELLERARDWYLDRLFERGLDAAYVVDKAPGNFARLGFLRLLFPDAVFVHSCRHPAATCWSLYTAHFSQHNPYYNSLPHLAHYYRTYQRLMTHWGGLLSASLVDVSYEALVSDPRPQLQRLLERIGLSWDERCMDLQANTRPVLTASFGQVRQSPYRSAIDRWQPFASHLQDLLTLQAA